MRADHAAALAAYAGRAERRNLSPKTVHRAGYVLRDFLAALGARRVARATAADVRRFLAGRKRERLVQDVSVLRVFFRTVLGDGAPLPTDGFKTRAPSPPPALLLSRDTVRALLAAALVPGRAGRDRRVAVRDRACLELLYGVGLRASELRAARVSDLDLVEGTLLVRRAKRGKWRALPLPRAALPHLERYLREVRPAFVTAGVDSMGFLFLTRDGRPLYVGALVSMVERLARLVGRRAHPHAFRRALATHLVRDGVSERVVQELLGHVSLATTARYVVVDREDLHRAVTVLERERAK